MARLILLLFVGVPFLGTPIAVVWVWILALSNRDQALPKWRVAAVWIGLIACSLSVVLSAYEVYQNYVFLHAAYDPRAALQLQVQGAVFREWGFDLAVAALLAALLGKGRARLPLAIAAILGLLSWVPVVVL